MQLELFPEIRYRHDSDEITLLGEWLEDRLEMRLALGVTAPDSVALDYYRLADRLEELAHQCREFASEYTVAIP